MLNGASYFRTVKKGNLTVFNASLYEINKAIQAENWKESPLEAIVPEQYHEFLPLISKVLADLYPPHRPGIDHEVRLLVGESPIWEPLYSTSRTELVVFNELLEDNISKGFIRQSSSPFAAPVSFGKKPGRGL